MGLAQLENDLPAEAESTFRQLAKLTPADPLPFANLAVAALRQQKGEEALAWIGEAQAKSPGRADLWRIRGDVLQGMDRNEEALAAYRKAVEGDPQDIEAWYSLYRTAQAVGETGDQAVAEALKELARLRPENLMILLQSGQRAVRRGDRTGATQAFLRVREILGEAPPPAAAGLQQVLTALEAGDPATARGPAARLENVLKPTPLYQQGLRELSPIVRGTPVERFAQEPPPDRFGDPLQVRFRGASLASTPTAGRALALGDFDGDERPDIARVSAGESPRLEIQGKPPISAPAIEALLAADLDNDGKLDLIGHGPGRVTFWKGRGDGTFEDATAAAGLAKTGAEAAAVLDYDIEGDLDLALAGSAVEVFRNSLEGPLTSTGGKAVPPLKLAGIRDLAASDLDRDGDLDLVLAHAGGLAWLDNQRQGRFADRTAAGFNASSPSPSGRGGQGVRAPQQGATAAIVSADLDDDGLPDLIAAGDGLAAWRNRGGRFEPWPLSGLDEKGRKFTDLIALDADNDGRLDLAAAGPDVLLVLGRRGERDRPAFEKLTVEGAPPGASALAAGDLDGDGDLDLVAAGASGLHRLENLDGNRNHWLDVRLRALTQGSGKNNLQGIGSVVELRAGGAYQFREVTGGVTHLGLGRLRQADSVRVVWTNGVPQNRLRPQIDQRIVEEQVLKGSCPFLYAWDGKRFAFVTDLLWNAPLGLPVAEGVWAGAQPDELVRVDGAQPDNGVYSLRLTEELWEAAWFDAVRLWVVDHPPGVEVASSLRVIPGEKNPPPSDRLLASRDLRPVLAAWDGAGNDATGRVRERDEVYASGYAEGPYQGGAARPWTFTFDLGEAPGTPVRLHLDGWIFPADASLNLAAAQRRDLAYAAPRLEVETANGWQPLLPALGHPAGKTKPMVVDTPPLPPGAHRLRIVSTLWLAWNRIAWTLLPADDDPVVRARLSPTTADLHYRGFSTLLRRAPNAPHAYDYERTTRDSPWIPFPGRYTRYGDVRELLLETDDLSVILAPGDEIAVTFDAAGLPPIPSGWTRTVFLESHGWDKDADRNTWEAQQLEPLPFRAMSGYPYGPGESYPDTPLHREYRERWLTREQ
ncbi:MAG TPA: FG-GAP-like repeat-containing protein [Thermoanaerobaculia bacterium]